MTHRSARLLRRCLLAACAALLPALPCAAATANEVVNIILTSRFLEQERCDNLDLVSVQLLQQLHRGAGVNEGPRFSHEQVRAIAARYVDINAQLCEAITPIFATHDNWAHTYDTFSRGSLSNKGWDRFLSDEHAVRWARITAGFRTELIMLNHAVNLAMALRPEAFAPDARYALHTRQTRQLLDEIRRVSLTEDEAKLRFMLASLHEQPAFRAMMPARFDVASLAAIEAKTRQLGLHFVERYGLHFDDLYDARTRVLLIAAENNASGPELNATVRSATLQVKALVSKYR